MPEDDTLRCVRCVLEHGSTASKDKFLIASPQLLPKTLFVENVRCGQPGCHASGQIFHRFTSKAAVDRLVVSMSLGVGLLEQREPCFIFFPTLRKVE